jgi:hypothetical protein
MHQLGERYAAGRARPAAGVAGDATTATAEGVHEFYTDR